MVGTQTPNLTISTMYDYQLFRWVPVLITILFGKSTADYKVHWDNLFLSMGLSSYEEFKESFPGNTSDFSDALRVGFFNAVKSLEINEKDGYYDESNIASY